MNFRSNLFQTSLLKITAELFKIILTHNNSFEMNINFMFIVHLI